MMCDICSSKKVNFLFYSENMHGRNKISVEKFSVFSCGKCGVVFLKNVKINNKYYQRYYGKDYYKTEVKYKVLNKAAKIILLISVKIKEKIILSYFKNDPKITILDIGCNDGQFLEKLNTKRFEKYGLELNTEAINNCRKKGIRMYEGDITKVDFEDKKFDAVTLWHSLEHFKDPVKVFSKLKNILSDRGIIIIQTPNIDSFGFRYGRENWFHLDSPRHPYLYSRKTIEELGKRTNLKIIGITNEFYDYPLDLFWSIRSSPVKYIFYPFYPLVKYFSKEHLTYIVKKCEFD